MLLLFEASDRELELRSTGVARGCFGNHTNGSVALHFGGTHPIFSHSSTVFVLKSSLNLQKSLHGRGLWRGEAALGIKHAFVALHVARTNRRV